MAELDKLVGIEQVKKQVRALCDTAICDERRRLGGIVNSEKPNNHMIFLGNAGTGKTTVAQTVARMLHKIGTVPTDAFAYFESARSALVGDTVGSTAIQTKRVIESAMCTGLRWKSCGAACP